MLVFIRIPLFANKRDPFKLIRREREKRREKWGRSLLQENAGMSHWIQLQKHSYAVRKTHWEAPGSQGTAVFPFLLTVSLNTSTFFSLLCVLLLFVLQFYLPDKNDHTTPGLYTTCIQETNPEGHLPLFHPNWYFLRETIYWSQVHIPISERISCVGARDYLANSSLLWEHLHEYIPEKRGW